MAPERFRGESDARADVYALGLTLYELLRCGRRSTRPTGIELIDQVTQTSRRRLRKLDPAIPRDLETIVLKAIEKDPADRYATAGELAEDLRRFLDDRPIRARRVGRRSGLALVPAEPGAGGPDGLGLRLLVTIAVGALAWHCDRGGWREARHMPPRPKMRPSERTRP